MRRLIPGRPSPAMVVAFIALMAALAPSAAALRGVNLVSSNDIITGAVKKSEVGRDSVNSNEVREDNDPGGGLTGQQINESRLDTVPSAAGLSHRALIDPGQGGSGPAPRVVRGEGVTSVNRSGPGDYSVVFNREARTCVYLALLSGDDAGRVVVSDSTTNANAVNVKTFENGTPTDRSFHLALAC